MPVHIPGRIARALLGAALAGGIATAAAVPASAATPAAAAGVPAAVRTLTPADAPAVYAPAAYLVDVTGGREHYGKRADERRPVASLTKMMTAYVVLKEAKPTDTVEVTAEDVRNASRGGAAVAGLAAGDRLTVEDVLHALLLPSGADAAHVLARTYGPGVDAFVAKMNATARELGMRDTHYVNADGMPTGGGGYSTARDQARLAAAVLADPTLKAITSTRYHEVPATAEHGAYSWRNTNRLLGEPGVIGVKTGYTRAAGYTLAFAADRGGRRLVGVILGETSSARRFATAGALLDWAAARSADR
ncbi:MAG: D-alanyl-D-alanine carboxypeptidase family protein [Actinomycetes bacterium]|jgi:D-alanyl-D-alanine carboxypeptidase (penicillin-binding protein 5/6)|nr:MAG: D-alanyl-D-alanine carboxypeptidase [Actinomycetota bacterium]